MYLLTVKPIQGGRPSLYFFDQYIELAQLHSKHFNKGYSCRAFFIPAAVSAVSLFEEAFGTVLYKIEDAHEVSSLSLQDYLARLEFARNIVKIIL